MLYISFDYEETLVPQLFLPKLVVPSDPSLTQINFIVITKTDALGYANYNKLK